MYTLIGLCARFGSNLMCLLHTMYPAHAHKPYKPVIPVDTPTSKSFPLAATNTGAVCANNSRHTGREYGLYRDHDPCMIGPHKSMKPSNSTHAIYY